MLLCSAVLRCAALCCAALRCAVLCCAVLRLSSGDTFMCDSLYRLLVRVPCIPSIQPDITVCAAATQLCLVIFLLKGDALHTRQSTSLGHTSHLS